MKINPKYFLISIVLLPLRIAGADTALEERLTRLEQEVQALHEEVRTLRALLDAPAEDPEEPAAGASLRLESWSFREVKVKFHHFQALDLTFYNGYAQTIRELEARLDFKDLLGEHLYSIRLPTALEIPAGTRVTDRGTATNKRLFGKGSVLQKFKGKNVLAELTLKRIVFVDGSVEEFQ